MGLFALSNAWEYENITCSIAVYLNLSKNDSSIYPVMVEREDETNNCEDANKHIDCNCFDPFHNFVDEGKFQLIRPAGP